MKKRPPDPEDDGRTIADMSGVSRPPLLIPRIPALEKKRGEPGKGPELSPSEEKSVVLGALVAALLIALVFIGAGALLIWLLTLIW